MSFCINLRFLDKLENLEKKENELNNMVEQSKNSVNKKDSMYAKMLKMKEKKIQNLNKEIEKLHNYEKSRLQTVDYFKKRIQVLEKSSKECERCKAYAKKKYYKESPVDYDTDLNGQSEKLSEMLEGRRLQNDSPKGGSVVNLNLRDHYDDSSLKPNHVEKLSLALENSLKKNNS